MQWESKAICRGRRRINVVQHLQGVQAPRTKAALIRFLLLVLPAVIIGIDGGGGNVADYFAGAMAS